MSKPNEYDTYIIPPNFIEGGTFFGGLLKLRNTAEALVIVLAIGIPVFSVSALTLTAIVVATRCLPIHICRRKSPYLVSGSAHRTSTMQIFCVISSPRQ